MEAPLSGIVTIAIVIAMVCAAWGMFALELSLLAALGLYSLSGTLALLFLGWRRYRCVEYHEK
ncbi:hypothetical protein [Paracoccus yeei]|uniref:Uncharacterized protein n=1 Tax=Paracoccus yeei TaxID=147645 RepID=A0A5P2QXQ9_9RHOB|nr:hypothetical protein [Paracoccus yeei]QEU10126.1 hypothetical protein FOB51_20150 [Paracoccus yeei]